VSAHPIRVARRACRRLLPRSPEQYRRLRSCASSGATQAHVFRPPRESNSLALGGLWRSVVLAGHDRRATFVLALEHPVIALENSGDDLRREPRVTETDPLGAHADR